MSESPSHRYYWSHREQRKAEARQYARAHREERKAYMARYWQEHDRTATQREYTEWLGLLNDTWECDVCGDAVYDWHHIDPADKKFPISHGRGRSLDALEAELEKCIPACRSCHNRIHERGGAA